jgi:hypothetical protein
MKLTIENAFEEPTGTPVVRKPIQESLRALLRNAQCSAKIGICVGCGVTAEFQKATMFLWEADEFLWEADETIEVTLPVCRECASSKGSGRSLPTTERSRFQ